MAKLVGRKPIELNINSIFGLSIPIYDEITKTWTTVNRNDIISGSVNISGSNFLVGDQSISGSLAITGSLIVNGQNYETTSASFASRITTNSASISQLSGSYLSDSSSFSNRATTNSASIASLSGSYLTDSASFDVRINNNNASISSLSGSYLTDSASFGDRITTNSSSISSLSASFNAFSGSFNTSSFSGSFNGRFTGSFSGSLNNLRNSVVGHIPFFSSSQVLSDSIARQIDNGSGSFSIVINQDGVTTAAPEALYVWQPSSTSYNVISGKGNLDDYLQLNIQNVNAGGNASSDIVATANNGTETTNYIDMGINGENFSGSIGDANDAYLYSTGNHLHIGNATAGQYVGFFAGGDDVDANMKLILDANNSHELTGSLSITEKLNVLGGITASLQGTASWALNSLNANTASYVTQAQSASYWSGSIINAATASYVLNAQTASYIQNAQSASYWSGSIMHATTASYVENAQTASYVTQAQSASYWSGSILNASTASSADNFTVRGTLTAQTINVQTITSSVEFVTGSTHFGSITSNTHEFTGSVSISGSLGINGIDYNSTSASFDSRILTNSSSISTLSGSYLASSASFDTRSTNNSASIALLSGSFLSVSESNSTRITSLEQFSSSLDSIYATDNQLNAATASLSGSIAYLSGSYLTDSASFAARITTNSSSISTLSGSYLADSASFDTRITTNSASISQLSSSYLVSSASFDTRIITNSASIAQLSGSYLTDSASFSTRITTNSASNAALSSSYVVDSASFADRSTINSSSIAQLSSSYLASSASFNSRINVISSSYATTGSNVFIGNESITGSLLVSGSTTQIGTNIISGNTLITGSLTISGSHVLNTPNIQIYGDTELNGAIKFTPVSDDINTSISASYIFASGSTNDLYFSQNANGFANITRLRWLEGNLYTGLLSGGVISIVTGSTTFNVSSGSGIIVTINASVAREPYPTIQYVNWGSKTSVPLTYLTSSIQSYIGIDANGDVLQFNVPYSDGQYNTSISLGTVLHQNKSTINASITYPNVAYGYKQRTYDFVRAFGPLKLSGYTIGTTGSLGLTVGSGTAFSEGRNYQTDPSNPSYITDSGTSVSKIFRYYQSGSEFVQDTNNGAGYTAIDPGNYNNNGTITSVSPATPYTIQRVFYYPNSATKGIVVYYGNAQYASLTDAIANTTFENFSEVENTKQNAVFLGYLVVRYNADFTDVDSYRIIAGGIFRGIGGAGGGGQTITQILSGLSDVAISGPTDHQPLAYDTTAGKWTNQSSISASLKGNADTATSASFATTAVSASYFSGSVSNAVTAITASYAVTASYLLGQSPTASYALTASYVPLAQTASYVQNAQSASYALTASYLLGQSPTASYALTASYADNFIVGGTLTAQTIVAQTITSSIEFVTGSTRNGSLLTNTHQFTGSVSVTGSLSVNGSNVIRSNQTSSMSVATASFATTAISASHAATASSVNRLNQAVVVSGSLTVTGSTNIVGNSGDTLLSTNADTLIFTGSLLTSGSIALTGSLSVFGGITGSHFGTSSYATQALSASYWSGSVINAATASYVVTAQTASYVVQAQSASYWSGSTINATSASYADNANLLDGKDSTIFATTGSNIFIGNQTITGSLTTTEDATIRNAYIGLIPAFGSNYMSFSHINRNGTNDYSLLSDNAGITYLNAKSGNSLNFRIDNIDKVIIDSNGNLGINKISPNTKLDVDGDSLITGSLVVTNGITSSLFGTASYATQATTASYALTASYISGSGGGVGFPFSGSAVITGSLLVSQSFVDFTQASYVTGSFTGSFNGTVATASYASYAVYAGNSPGTTATMTQSIAATTWSFTHNLNTRTPLLQVYDSTRSQIIPYAVVGSDPLVATIYFDTPESGYAVASNGGTLTVSGSTARLDQVSAAVTWSFTHNLATKYPNFEIWDSNDNIVIPAGIHAVSDMNAEIYFAFPTTGTAIASFSGIAGSPNATTASYAVSSSYVISASFAATSSTAISSSYAATASYANNFTVANTLILDQTLTDYHTVASSIVGDNNLFTKATGSYTSAFVKYTLSNGTNARSGEIITVWNGTTTQYVDNSTVDIGDTSPVVISTSIVSSEIQINAATSTSGWKIKAIGTFM